MNLRKIKACTIAVLITVVALLAACSSTSSGAGQKVNLHFTFWLSANTPQYALFQQMANEYTQQHPNTTITFESIPLTSYQSKITLELSGNTPPDAGWIIDSTAKSWEASGVLTDIGSVVRGDSAYNFNDFSPAAMQLWAQDNAVYGIPFSTSPLLIMYNKDLFTKAGVATPDQLIAQGQWTWASFAAEAKQITEKTGVYGLESADGALYTGNFWTTIIPIMRAYGGDAWNAQYVCGFNSSQSITALQFIHDMIFVDKSMVPPGTQGDFYSGGAAAAIGQLSRLNNLAKASFSWSIAPLPSGPAGYHPVTGQAALVVFRNSPNRAAAEDFIKFLTTQQNVTRLAQFFPPARASVLATTALAKANPLVPSNLMASTVIAPIKTGQVLPTNPNLPNVQLAMQPFLDQLWTPNANVASIANNMCTTIQPQLKS